PCLAEADSWQASAEGRGKLTWQRTICRTWVASSRTKLPKRRASVGRNRDGSKKYASGWLNPRAVSRRRTGKDNESRRGVGPLMTAGPELIRGGTNENQIRPSFCSVGDAPACQPTGDGGLDACAHRANLRDRTMPSIDLQVGGLLRILPRRGEQ